MRKSKSRPRRRVRVVRPQRRRFIPDEDDKDDESSVDIESIACGGGDQRADQ